VPGQTGEFSVIVDGKQIWDKLASGRFPEHDEILRQL
jgi:selT/selW/selH-like putative selenoprotein